MKNNRQAWLNAYRVVSIILLIALAVMSGILLQRSFMPTTSQEVSKVERASAYLEAMGFRDPVYEGVQPYVEGSYPKFEVTAIGGERLGVFVRTNPDGGWSIQPEGMFEFVSSADDFARYAQKAVLNWEYMPDTIEEGTSEWQSRKNDYDHFAKYNPPKDYWGWVDETTGWPTR